MFVSFRNARRRDHGIGAGPQLAIATGDAAFGRVRDNSPSRARAQRTNFSGCLHEWLNQFLILIASTFASFTLHPTPPPPPLECVFCLCTSCGAGETIVENAGNRAVALATKVRWHVKPGVWHVFAIDNPQLG